MEGGPVEGLLEDGVRVSGMEEPEFGVAQGGGGVFALEQLAIKRIHQRWRGSFTDFPESSDDVVGAGTEEGPREAYQALAGIGAGARAIAGGDGHQIGVQAVLNDIPGIELVGVTLFAEDHRRLQRTGMAGGPVRDEVEIGKAFRIAAEIGRGGGLLPFQHFGLRIRKILFDLAHFLAGLRDRREGWIRRLGVADQKETFFRG